jgi:hypothetical protein
VFGVASDHFFGGGRTGLRWTFVVMLVPLGGSAALLFAALQTYPRDVVTAAAAGRRTRAESPARPRPAHHAVQGP